MHRILFLAGSAESLRTATVCRFAEKFEQAKEFSDPGVQDDFLAEVVQAERKFFATPFVGYDGETGWTYDGVDLDPATGLTRLPQVDSMRPYTAPSKEALQLSLLALSIQSDPPANPPFSEEEALKLLGQKGEAYNLFATDYPQLGGWLPWLCSRGAREDGFCKTIDETASRAAPTTKDALLSVYDNGEWAWAVYTVAKLTSARSEPEWAPVAEKFNTILQRIRDSAANVWLHDNSICASVSHTEGKPDSMWSCAGLSRGMDPYEAELLFLFVDLLAPGLDPKVQDSLWEQKQALLIKKDLYGTEVQAGYFYSSHELWKLLMLPYMDLPKTKQVFVAGEVARTRHARLMGHAGLTSASDMPTGAQDPSGCPNNYCTSAGIPELALDKVLVEWTIVPYAAFPTILADRAVGMSWYNSMLQQPRMQTALGSGEAVAANGTIASSLLTWDGKATVLLAMYGGLGPVVKPFLQADGVLERFNDRVETMYKKTFGEPTLTAEAIPWPSDGYVPTYTSLVAYPTCGGVEYGPNGALALILGLFVAHFGGSFMAIVRIVIGGIFGSLPAYYLNLVHTLLLCKGQTSSLNVAFCASVDDPTGAGVLVGFFCAMLAWQSVRLGLVMLCTLAAEVVMVLLIYTIPDKLPNEPMLLGAAVAGLIIGLALAYLRCCFGRFSRLITITTTAMVGGFMIVGSWYYSQHNINLATPWWTQDGTTEDFRPIFAWVITTLVCMAWQVWKTSDHERNSGDCEAVADMKFHKSQSLPRIASAEVPLMDAAALEEGRNRRNTNALYKGRKGRGSGSQLVSLSEGDEGAPKESSLGMRPLGMTRNRAGNASDNSMASGDAGASTPDLQNLEREARLVDARRLDQNSGAADNEATRGDGIEAELNKGTVMDGHVMPHKDSIGAKAFLWVSLLLTLAITSAVPYTIHWGLSNIVIGVIFCLFSWFLLWNVVDVFMSSIAYHFVRIVFGFFEVQRANLLSGLPNEARTFVQYCVLSESAEQSLETFETAYQCYLNNLDPNGNIAVAVVSVTNKLSIVAAEVNACDNLQQRFLREMEAEQKEFMIYLATAWPPVQHEQCPNPAAHSAGLVRRWYFWTGLAVSAQSNGYSIQGSHKLAETADTWMTAMVAEMALNFMYLHRNCRVLKKPGQYQDAIILAYTGDNLSYTYTDPKYGRLGRLPNQHCFGFSGNIVPDSSEDMERTVRRLQKQGARHVSRLRQAGQHQPYRYSMVMDSDTVSGWRSILRVAEYAVKNPEYGIFQCHLAIDDTVENPTWYMWAEVLRQASALNIPKASFSIFRRHGFYGKGFIDNELMLRSVIGRKPEPKADGTYEALEALPVDIMSHDTFEAKILRPCYIPDVALLEEPAKNAISSFPQTTRWMVGEVRNASYPPGLFRNMIILSQRMYGLVYGDAPKPPFARQYDVPCGWSTEHLSHVSFRIMHAGPAVMSCILIRTYLMGCGLLHFRNAELGLNLTIFTFISIFVIPKGLLALDLIPSFRFGARKPDEGCSYEPSAKGPVAVIRREETLASGCGMLWTRLLLSVVEAVLSVLIFGPECLLGLQRMCNAYWSQISGRVTWVPQAVVDKEVEKNTMGSLSMRMRFVLKHTWHIPLIGIFIAVTTYMLLGSVDVLSMTLWVSWILHPIITCWGCSPRPSGDESWIVRLVMSTRTED